MEKNQITGSKFWITAATMCAAMMSVLDISIVNVALSDIRASFGTPLDQIAWVSTGYAMANITIIPLSGWLQRKFGFKRYYASSIVIFTIASALCGLAWNLPSLVVFRILQGLGGGAIIPTSQAILFARYPVREHGMAGALFGIGSITGPLLGPTLGGYLIDAASWHWIFLINVPFGLFAAYIAYKHIDEPDFKPTTAAVDVVGIGLLAVGMASLQYVLEEGNRDGWLDSPLITVLAATAAICLITFIFHELDTEHPVVDLRVFGERSYLAATILNFLVGTSLFAGSFLYSLFCGQIMHYKALDIGLLFLKGSWIQLLVMPLVGRLMGTGRIDQRLMIAVGIAGMTVSLWLNAGLTPAADPHIMMMPILARALSLGLIFVPMSVVALSGLKPAQRGNGAGLFNLTRELGGSIGTAWMSTALSSHSKQHFADLSRNVDIYSPVAMEQLHATQGALGRLWDSATGALGSMYQRVLREALVMSFTDNFTTLAMLFACSIGLVFMLKKAEAGMKAPAGH
jgi:DHA2 family multidrug resistance protein